MNSSVACRAAASTDLRAVTHGCERAVQAFLTSKGAAGTPYDSPAGPTKQSGAGSANEAAGKDGTDARVSA